LEIKLDKFNPRPYQLPLCQALEYKGFKKLLAVWPRRSGKDFVAFNLCLRAAMERIGNYVYCLPTFQQARRVIWDSISNDGTRFLDLIPKELIKNLNQAEMKITLINGSMIQLAGSDTYNTSLVGTNPVMVIFSEFALSDGMALAYTRPILAANDGTLIVLSTPRGRNALFDLYKIAKEQPDWFVSLLTLEDTKHISKETIDQDIKSGLMSGDMAQQEYYSSFNLGIEGSVFGRYLDLMKLEGRIGNILWQANHEVHTAWDLGRNDTNSIIFYQVINNNVYIIDFIADHFRGMDYYIKLLKEKPYIYGCHFAPHDINVHEYSNNITRMQTAKNLGFIFKALENRPKEEGIEQVRCMLPRTYIDETRCKYLIKAIEFYRREYNERTQTYSDIYVHDWASHPCDALRYLAMSLSKIRKGTTPEELEDRYRSAMFGEQSNLPHIFRS